VSEYSAVVSTREGAHEAATAAYGVARNLVADGKRAFVEVREFQDDRSLQQNRYYWGVVLADISEQARIGGQRYTVDAWHELFKRQFLGYEIERVRVAGRKSPVVIRRLKSTAKQKVKAMSVYLEKVQAFAAADLGVAFSETRWEDYRS
jgi:hypothetical protein